MSHTSLPHSQPALPTNIGTNSCGLPKSLTDFLKFYGPMSIGDFHYVFVPFEQGFLYHVIQPAFVKCYVDNGSSKHIQRATLTNVLTGCTQLRPNLTRSNFAKRGPLEHALQLTSVDNHMGLFAVLQISLTSLTRVHHSGLVTIKL